MVHTSKPTEPSEERVLPMGSNQRNYIEHLARYDFSKQFVKKDMRVLDAACGMGYGSHLLATFGCHVTGGDVSSDALEYAQAHYQHHNLSYVSADCRSLDFPAATFDAYISFETIEHFLEQDAYLSEAKRVLKTGGVFICSTPNKDVHEFYRRKGWMGPNPYSLKQLDVQEFTDMLDAHFGDVEYYGQDYDPLALKMRETDRLLSELRWEMDRLPLTMAKRLMPAGIRKWLAGTTVRRSELKAEDYSLDMIRISRLNVDNSDTIIAVCRE